MTSDKTQKANNRTLAILATVALLMFGFGYALVPLYDLICDVTGLNGKTGRTDVASAEAQNVDATRRVKVEFTGHTDSGLPWDFRPLVKKMEVTPGKLTLVKYYARNTGAEAITGQAVPSVAPNKAATYFKKVECFCFSEQTLQPGEEKEMPVRFIVDARLAQEVDTITLSYAFFNTDKVSARKYGGKEMAPNHEHDHHAKAHEASSDVPPINNM
ncbi:MAG: cytochrome c oxidase assembly protein [Gammaproteobacteria bacterium]|nr:cytochrome c oxidase assembly protein [Gammaproteobacteria bacterium]